MRSDKAGRESMTKSMHPTGPASERVAGGCNDKKKVCNKVHTFRSLTVCQHGDPNHNLFFQAVWFPSWARDLHGYCLVVSTKALFDVFIVLHFSKMFCCFFAMSI